MGEGLGGGGAGRGVEDEEIADEVLGLGRDPLELGLVEGVGEAEDVVESLLWKGEFSNSRWKTSPRVDGLLFCKFICSSTIRYLYRSSVIKL